MSEPESLPQTDRLLRLVERMAGQPILMVVDLVADRFITGTPKRISREAPVLILSYEGESFAPGGGANAVANVAALGGEPLPLGVIGSDDSGRQLREAMRRLGVSTDGILERPGFRTPTKTRILGGGRHAIKQQIVRYDVEDRIELTGGDQDQFARALDRWAGRARVAVLSDYGYGAVSPELIAPVRRALAEGATLLADSRHRLAEFHGLDGATPNEEEAEDLLGAPLPEDPRLLLARGRDLLARLSARFLLITRGSRGMALVDNRGLLQIPVHGTDQVADVTGAGDTVIGTFALALAAGATPAEAALLANYAGGVVVMKMGTATLTPEELRSAVAGDPGPLRGMRWEK